MLVADVVLTVAMLAADVTVCYSSHITALLFLKESSNSYCYYATTAIEMIEITLEQEQVMAEQRKMLMMSMMRKRMPNAMHRYSSHNGWMSPQSKTATFSMKFKIQIQMNPSRKKFNISATSGPVGLNCTLIDSSSSQLSIEVQFKII